METEPFHVSCSSPGAGDTLAAMWAVASVKACGGRVVYHTTGDAANAAARLFLKEEEMGDATRQKVELFLPQKPSHVGTVDKSRARYYFDKLPERFKWSGMVAPTPLPHVFPLAEDMGKIVVFPDSIWSGRSYPAHLWARVAGALESDGRKVVFLTTPNHLHVLHYLKVQDCRAAESWLHLSRIISGASLVLCNDSGPLHLAAALGVPTVAVFAQMTPAGLVGDYPTVSPVVPTWAGTCAGCHWQPERGHGNAPLCRPTTCHELPQISPLAILHAARAKLAERVG